MQLYIILIRLITIAIYIRVIDNSNTSVHFLKFNR